MKKFLPALLCIFFVIISCDFQLPRGVRITGTPGLRVPIGRPAHFMPDGRSIGTLIHELTNDDEIMRRLREAGVNINGLFHYHGNSTRARTFMLHYNIFELPVDISRYIDNINFETGFSVPPFDIPAMIRLIADHPLAPPFPTNGLCLSPDLFSKADDFIALGDFFLIDHSSCNCEPLFAVELPNLVRLVEEITGRFGLQFEGDITGANLEDSFMLKIPAFGMDNFEFGDLCPETGKLQFLTSLGHTFYPRKDLDDGVMKIFVRLMEPIAGTITPEIVLDWEKAVILAMGENEIDGDFPIGNFLEEFLEDFGEFFGNVRLSQLDVYIYFGLGGMDTSGELRLSSGNKSLLEDITDPKETVRLNEILERPGFRQGVPVMEIPEHSLTHNVDFSWVLNDDTDAGDLKYGITIDRFRIIRDHLHDNERQRLIYADIIVLLPLEFKFINDGNNLITHEGKNYIRMELGEFAQELDWSDRGDLFGRAPDEDGGFLDNVFEQIEYVRVVFRDFVDEFIGNIFFRIYQEGELNQFVPLINRTNPHLLINNVPNPFLPAFTIFLQTDNDGTSEDHAYLRIRRPPPGRIPELDFFLEIQAKTNLDLSFSW